MRKARIFKSGNSQALRLPKEFRFRVDEVEILRRGQEVVQREPKRNLGQACAALGAMPDDFMAEGRRDETPQKRKALCQPRLHCQRCSGSDGRRNASEVVFAILSNGATSPYVDATSRPTLDGSRRICQ